LLIAPRGELSFGALSLKASRKAISLFLLKLFNIYRDCFFHATSIDEKYEIVNKLGIDAKNIFVASNIPTIEDATLPFNIIKQQSPLKFVFLSRVSPKKNIKFAITVLSHFKDIDVVFDIFGPVDDKKYWQECQYEINRLPGNITVNYRHEIHPQDVASTLSEYHAFLFPTLGENYGHVIVESLLVGTPVLISDLTPWHNINELGLGLASPLNTPKNFFDEINNLLPALLSDSLEQRQARIQVAKSLVGVERAIKDSEKMFNQILNSMRRN